MPDDFNRKERSSLAGGKTVYSLGGSDLLWPKGWGLLPSSRIDGQVGRWGSHQFVVRPDLLRSFKGLQIKASSETTDKANGKQKFVARKNGKAVEVSLTVVLNSAMGCDVRLEVENFVADAKAGYSDYFYVGNMKLMPCKLMLTDVTAKEIRILPNGTWANAEVQLTMKQSSKDDAQDAAGSSNKKSGGSKKASTKKSSTTTSKKAPDEAWRRLTPSQLREAENDTAKKKAAAAKKTVSSAKKTTAAKKSTTAKKKATTSAPRGSANRK